MNWDDYRQVVFIYKPHFGAPRWGGWKEIIFKLIYEITCSSILMLLTRLLPKTFFLLKWMLVFSLFSVAIVLITLPSCTCHSRSINTRNRCTDFQIIHLESTLVYETDQDDFSGADSTLNATWMISSVLAGLHRTARPITYSRKSILPSWFCERMVEIS